MVIGVLSDTHNNVGNLQKALEVFRARGIHTLIHCGDMTSNETAAYLAGFKVIFVLGNIDRDRDGLRAAILSLNPSNFAGDRFAGMIDGQPVAVIHGHQSNTLKEIVGSGAYRYVFHGHSHRRRDERVGTTRIVNPGALGGKRDGPRSICVLDVAEDVLEFVNIDAL